jgi:hypothetical protein
MSAAKDLLRLRAMLTAVTAGGAAQAGIVDHVTSL